MNWLVEQIRALAGRVVVPRFQRKLERFRGQMATARVVQRELLFQKIRRCQDSAFGRDHKFRDIRTVEDFRRNIPIAQYDYYFPYIDRVANGDIAAMFPASDRILMFTLSSGTTDAPKLIPINDVWMSEYRAGWQIWGIKAFLDHPKLFFAKLSGMAGNWDMRRTPTQKPCGMASGLSAKMQSPIVKTAYSIPASVYTIGDAAAKYYTALRLAVAEENTGLFLTATPATVVTFSKLGNEYREALIRDIHDGTLSNQFDVPDRIRREIRRRVVKPNPDRARKLEQIVERTGHLYPKDYWDLSLVACWLGGTVGSYARHLADYCGSTPQRDIGLLCSEGRFTIPMNDGTPAGALEIASHYYEFIPEAEIDSPQPTVLECHELEVGKNYFILLTTSCGLYRYNIYDVMRCTGYEGETPLLEFLNKGQRFSDMEGEKISEFHLVAAVNHAADREKLHVTAFTAVPVRPADSQPPYYAILMEEQDVADVAAAHRFVANIDRWLADNNVMYQGKRDDGYLGPPRLVRVAKGSFAEYDRAEIARRNVGEDHYKHPCLVLDQDFIDRLPKPTCPHGAADSSGDRPTPPRD